MSGKIGRLVRGLVQAQQELHHQQKLQEEEQEDEVEEVVEPACDLLAVLRGAVAPADEDYIETPIDTGELILSYRLGSIQMEIHNFYISVASIFKKTNSRKMAPQQIVLMSNMLFPLDDKRSACSKWCDQEERYERKYVAQFLSIMQYTLSSISGATFLFFSVDLS